MILSEKLSETKEKLSLVSLADKKWIFSAYSSGQNPDGWEPYFKAMREAENDLIHKYAYLPDNKAVSLARGAIWDLFIEI